MEIKDSSAGIPDATALDNQRLSATSLDTVEETAPVALVFKQPPRPPRAKKQAASADAASSRAPKKGRKGVVVETPPDVLEARYAAALARISMPPVDAVCPSASRSLMDIAARIAEGRDESCLSWQTVFHESLDDIRHACSMVQMTSYFPLPSDVFRCYQLCSLQDIRVVIIGQDPYPEGSKRYCPEAREGVVPMAQGLCFSVHPEEMPLPPSLRAIYQEMSDCSTDAEWSDAFFGVPYFPSTLRSALPSDPVANGDLRYWCRQGVFLLNSSLTVAPNRPDSHRGVWNGLVVRTIQAIALANPDVVFCFWGARAQSLSSHLSSSVAQFECGHPSPRARSSLSKAAAPGGFLGSRHFAKVNRHLMSKGFVPIVWHRPLVAASSSTSSTSSSTLSTSSSSTST